MGICYSGYDSLNIYYAAMANSEMQNADIGVVGLAVMGQNLVLNMADHGYTVAVYNRTTEVVRQFVQKCGTDTPVIGTHSLEALVARLRRPRRVLLMVQAGKPVDSCIQSLLFLLAPGDIIIDAGNSHYKDTERRAAWMGAKGIHYIGTGVSGGEEGARTGPSIMPGGASAAWPHLKELFQSISAKVDQEVPCCDWIGPGGAGHFVKMVHNGIEYGDMQIIAEAYMIMRDMLRMDNAAMSQIFGEWNEGPLRSYLIEITRDILSYRDADDAYVIDQILDCAGQKGTGKWTMEAALNSGVPLTLIGEAVSARFLSSLKEERQRAETFHTAEAPAWAGDRSEFLPQLAGAVYCAKLLSYAQGFMLMRAVSESKDWNLNYGRIADLWRGGCIIRSGLLRHIHTAYWDNPALENILTAPYFREAVRSGSHAFRTVVAEAMHHGIPVPALSSALAFYDGYRRGQGAANLIQAQRDYFGAHTYERIDCSRGEFFHTNWTGRGGETTSGSYDA